MATMIPAAIPQAPEADRAVFDLLQDDPATDGWVILYRVRPPHTEPGQPHLDFVALVPNTAILCVELMRGGFEVRSGQWYALGSQDMIAPPGKQGEKAMDGLDDSLRAHFSGWDYDTDLPIDCVVLFTDTNWPPHMRTLAYPTIGLPELMSRQTLGERLAEIAREIQADIPDGIALDSQTIQDIQEYLTNDLALKVA